MSFMEALLKFQYYNVGKYIFTEPSDSDKKVNSFGY